jgi:hypothetical protein
LEYSKETSFKKFLKIITTKQKTWAVQKPIGFCTEFARAFSFPKNKHDHISREGI